MASRQSSDGLLDLTQCPERDSARFNTMAPAGRRVLLTPEQEISLAQALEAARMQRNGRQERRLTETLVMANLGLVATAAHQFTGRGVPTEDLIQEGSIGLMTAVQRFDWRRRCRFSTYATWWIRSAMQRAISEQACMIRIPASAAEALRRVLKARTALSQRMGRLPTQIELAEAAGISESELSSLLRSSAEPLSLETPMDERGDIRLADLIPATEAHDPSAAAERGALSELLHRSLNCLTPQEREVLKIRYGLYGGESHTLEETSRALKMPRLRAYKIESMALKKLRASQQSALHLL